MRIVEEYRQSGYTVCGNNTPLERNYTTDFIEITCKDNYVYSVDTNICEGDVNKDGLRMVRDAIIKAIGTD